jgi:chemotaxis-related protein WspB
MLLLTFKAGANRYAIDVARVIELVPRVELTTIPHAPSFLAGLLGFRGKVIPVIDLGSLLNSVPCRDCLSTRIILVNDATGDENSATNSLAPIGSGHLNSPAVRAPEARLLGLIGEQVSDLNYIQPDQLAPAPVQLRQMSFLDAIVQTDEGIIQLIAVERIREAALGDYILDQGTPPKPHPLKADTVTKAREDLAEGV